MAKPIHVIVHKSEEREESFHDFLAFLFIGLFIAGITALINFDKYDTWAIVFIILGVLGLVWRVKVNLSR